MLEPYSDFAAVVGRIVELKLFTKYIFLFRISVSI